MPNHRLNDKQLAFFDLFGFLSLPGLLSDRIGEITDAFEETFKSHGGGHAGRPHEGKARSCIVPFIDQNATLSSLLDDPRIEGLLASLLGDDFNYMGSDGNYYVGDTPWHSDGWHTEIRHLKVAIYLDPLTRDSGCLRVIPGSHRVGDGYAETLQKQFSSWDGRDLPAMALETNPGDVVVFNHNLKHAAFGGGSWRRMFTINCAQRFPESKLEDLRAYIGSHARFWIDRLYGETMVRTATPARRVHLEQVMANDGHMKELAQRARATMREPARG